MKKKSCIMGNKGLFLNLNLLSSKSKKMDSYVYLIKGRGMIFKIGRTNDVVRRLREHQTSTYDKLTLIDYCPGGSELEKSFHRSYKVSKGATNEWFSLTEEQCFNLLEEMGRVKIAAAQQLLIDLLNDEKSTVFCEEPDFSDGELSISSTSSDDSDSDYTDETPIRKSHASSSKSKSSSKSRTVGKKVEKKVEKSPVRLPSKVIRIMEVLETIKPSALTEGEYTISEMKEFYLAMDISCPTGKKQAIIDDLVYLRTIDFEKFYNGKCKVDELKDMCRKFDLPVSGTKPILSNKIREYLHIPAF